MSVNLSKKLKLINYIDQYSQNVVLIIFFSLLIGMHLLPFNKLGTGYIEQQWFVNYSSGFIRRGLFGELVKIADLNLSDIYIFFRFVITLSFTLFFGIIWRSFGHINSKNILYFLLVVTSPIFYSGYSKLNGRFDLIFSQFLILLFLIKNQYYAKFILFLSLPLGLMHELWLIFYIPLYLILVWNRGVKKISILILIFSILILISLWWLNLNPSSNIESMCSQMATKMSSLGYKCAKQGDISFVYQSVLDSINATIFWNREISFKAAIISFLEFACTTSYILIASLPIWFSVYNKTTKERINHLKIFLIISLYCFISLIALDWGRFLVDILQVCFMYLFINNKFNFEKRLAMANFLLLISINIIFIKLVFTRIVIL